ncbi:MAG TPA: glycosyltransferase family 4 protein [Longimicrobium sp.]|nr:glycosyltransferase family 4 protein [Longimicrobium sp.]
MTETILAQPRNAASRTRVLLTYPSWTLYRSTDREYIYTLFVRLAEKYPLEFIPNTNVLGLLAHNGRYLLDRALGLFGRFPGAAHLSVRVHAPMGADVAFAYGPFPDPAPELPILWEQTFAPTSARIDAVRWREMVRAQRRRFVDRADRIVTATEASVEHFRLMFPESAHKVSCIPYYLPHLEAVAEHDVIARFERDGPLDVLFVGKAARRKGLDILIQAYESLPSHIRRELRLTVISAMVDGRVSLPRGVVHYAHVPDVRAFLARSHVLALPTKEEAFGLILVEAMAHGCVVLTADAEIQRSIVGPGGLFADPFGVEAVRKALKAIVGDRASLYVRAHALRRRFITHLHHGNVGRAYASLVQRAANSGVPSAAIGV